MTYASVLVDIDCCKSCIAIQSGHKMRFRGIQVISGGLLLSLTLPQKSIFVTARYSLGTAHCTDLTAECNVTVA